MKGRQITAYVIIILLVIIVIIGLVLISKPNISGDVINSNLQNNQSENLNAQNNNQPVLYCGDGICNNEENCSSCSSDCGKCKTQGKLSFVENVGDNHGEFFDVCSGEGYPPWCEQISVNQNEFNVYVKTLKSLPFYPLADFVYRIQNLGTQKLENIETTILCDEVYPTNKRWVITDSSKSYNGIVLSRNSFNCATCSGNCACDNYPYGNKIIYILGSEDTTAGMNWNIDRWLEFNVEELNSDITLSCDINIFSENPPQSINSNLIIHFLVDR